MVSRRTLGRSREVIASIPNRPKLAKEIEELLGGDVVGQVLDEECAGKGH